MTACHFGFLSHECSGGPYIPTPFLSSFVVYVFITKKVTHKCKVTAVSTRSRRELTLIAGLAGEAGVALAFVGSHAVAVLAAGLTQS